MAAAYQKLKKRAFECVKAAAGSPDEDLFRVYRERFTEALGNDVNTASALTVLYDVLKADMNDATKTALIKDFDTVLGLDLTVVPAEEEKSPEIDPELKAFVEQAIEARKAAKAAKDFATADRIRNELLEKGIVLKDTREGTLWELAK